MKRIVLWIGIGLLTFIIGVSAAVAWFIYSFGPPDEALNQPPCGYTWRNQKNHTKCSALSSSSDISTVAFCDLLRDPDRYKQQMVRTQARLYADSGDYGLGDPACSGETSRTITDFDSSYGIGVEAQKAFDDFFCVRRMYYANKEADVVVVGRFDGLDGKAGDSYRSFHFVVICIEQARNQRLTYSDR